MQEDYLKARKMGERHYRRQVMAGRYPFLPALEDMVEGIGRMKEEYVGITEIPLSMVVGTRTAGRQNAFAANFMPLLPDRSEFALKWSTLYDAQVTDGIRDPVKVYEFMNYFYVLEGNKRVSVLKYVGAPLVAADVTRILPPDDGSPAVRIYHEFLRFHEATGIYAVTFSREGSYQQLADYFGEDLDKEWQTEHTDELRAAFDLFQEVMHAKGGERLPCTFGDAFLLYLKVFSLQSLLQDSRATVNGNVDRLWREFRTETAEKSVELVEEPDSVRIGPAAAQVNTIKSILNLQPVYSRDNPLRVYFLHDRTADQSSWIYGHELGRQELEDHFGGIVETITFDGLSTPEKADHALEAAAADEAGLILSTSPALMDASRRAAIRHPGLRIMNCSINLSVNSVRTYYTRMYEAKFLMGALAASLSEDHMLGYLADYPIYGNIANINAFALGASMVDPACKVRLMWQTLEGGDCLKELQEMGIRFISGTDMITPSDNKRRYGLFKEEKGELTRLAMPVNRWGRYYTLLVRKILDGSYDAAAARTGRALNYWWGMDAGVVDIILSDQFGAPTHRLMDLLRRNIKERSFMPFSGPLFSQNGEVPTGEKGRLTQQEIITMDWLCENVIGEIPEASAFKKSVRETVQVSGVGETRAL